MLRFIEELVQIKFRGLFLRFRINYGLIQLYRPQARAVVVDSIQHFTK